MSMNLEKEVAAMQRMTVGQLRTRYAEVFDEATVSGHKTWLVKRIAWRLQAQAEGELSNRARRRAEELANDADLRLSPPKPTKLKLANAEQVTVVPTKKDSRLPVPGTIIIRPYKGQTLQVLVRTDGFEYQGQIYQSLSSVAKAVTGSHCNGYLFFRFSREGGQR